MPMIVLLRGAGDLGNGGAITEQAMERLLTSLSSGLREMPAKARRVALLTQASTPELQAQVVLKSS